MGAVHRTEEEPMKTLGISLTFPLLLVFAAGCGDSTAAGEGSAPAAEEEAEEEDDDDEDTVIPIEDVPQAAVDAALAAVPGLVIEEAEDEGDGVFELSGSADGVPFEVDVDSEGNVILIESDEDDEEEEEDQD